MNFSKSSSLINRVFKIICEDMESDIDNLLYYAQLRMLSKGKVVKIIYSLIICLREQNMIELVMKWEEHQLVLGLPYLFDILYLLNTLNTSLQACAT